MGDFHRAAHAKGVHSILASKVKGHATDQDIDAGKHTPWLRQQNDRSDEFATKGTAATPLRCFDIAALYAERQTEFISLVIVLHKFIVHMVKADDKLRKLKANPFAEVGVNAALVKVDVVPALGYQAKDNTRFIKLAIDVAKLRKVAEKIDLQKPSTQSMVIFNFISSLSILPVSAQDGGVTWVELYLIFRLFAGYDVEAGVSPGSSRPHVAAILSSFKTNVLAVVKQSYN